MKLPGKAPDSDPPVDFERQDAQIKYLAWLKRLRPRKLRQHHQATFRDGEFQIHLPRFVPRYFLERRLHLYFMTVNYHLPDPFCAAFRKKVMAFLKEPYDKTEQEYEDKLLKDLRVLRSWLSDRSVQLDDRQVKRIVLTLGYCLHPSCPDEWWPQVLSELADRERDITVAYARNMQVLVQHRLNKHSLQKLILENPDMGWSEFQMYFGLEMPTVTPSSFYYTRSKLRSLGHELPDLRMAA